MELDYVKFEVAFSGEKHLLALPADSLVEDLKAQIEVVVGVSAPNQKLVGLPKAGDDVPLRVLPLKRPLQKIMLMGTRDDELRKAKQAEEAAALEAANVINDLDAVEDEDALGDSGDPNDISRKREFLDLIDKRIASYKPKILHGLRPEAKRLLVLDIDYTLIDHRTTVEHPLQMARPHLHGFLQSAYEGGYDIVIWSATSMSWIELKMREMGVTRSPHFKIAAFFDRGAMITVEHPTRGRVEVKPLPVLWGMYPAAGHGPHSTIMFDDLRRNFLMNPSCGLRIEACRNMPAIRGSDRELLHLSKYLLALAALPSFEGVDHREWRHYLADKCGYRAALEDDRARRKAEKEREAAAHDDGSSSGLSSSSSSGAGAGSSR